MFSYYIRVMDVIQEREGQIECITYKAFDTDRNHSALKGTLQDTGEYILIFGMLHSDIVYLHL